MFDSRYLFCDRDNTNALIAENVHPFTALSDGSKVYGRIHTPAVFSEGDRTPLVLFLHGFPGLERNMDVPYCLSRAGIAAAYFAFRGVWGSHGEYSFSHLIEDVFAVIKHLTDRADTYHIDPERVYIVGHSMGGFTTMNAIAQGVHIRGAILMCPCDMGGAYLSDKAWADHLLESQKGGYFTLASDTVLSEELEAHAAEWSFVNLTDKLPESMPLHFIGGTKDTVTPPEKHIKPVYEKLLSMGRKVTYAELEDSHNIPRHRTTLTKMLFDRIVDMEK